MTHVKEWVLDVEIGWFESLIPCVKFGIGGAEALNVELRWLGASRRS